MKKTLVLILALFTLTLITISCITTYGEDDITTIQIKNMTNVVFDSLRIREVGTTSWVTRNETFGTETVSVYFYTPLDVNKRYEIQLRSNLEISATKTNVLLAENGIVTFNVSDFDDDQRNEITTFHILNDTGVDFSEILIGISGTSSWIVSRTIPMNNGTITTISNIDPPLKRLNLYNVQVIRNELGFITATKSHILLSHNGVVRFEKDDLDL